jgi:hypothetical protein
VTPEVETGDDGGFVPDPACIAGYDSANPELKIMSMEITAPSALATPAWQALLQTSIDSGGTIYLLAFHDIAGDGSHSADVGAGTAGTGTYSFVTGMTDAVQIDLTGNDFTTGTRRYDLVMRLGGTPTDIDIPLAESGTSGTFTTAERCSIGSGDTSVDPPVWEMGGIVDGFVTVAGARATPLPGGRSLCDVIAGGSCAGDPGTWPNPPDATTSDGLQAWRTEIHFAALAVMIVP